MGTYRGAGNKETIHQEHSGQGSGNPETITLLQAHYLGLLERLIDLKNSYQADPGREEWLLKAINKATYSAFRSCVEQEVEAEAKALLSGERQAN